MSLHKLVYDTNDVASSHTVGSYLLSADGTEITHTNIGGKDALDVNIASPLELQVSINAEYAEDSIHSSGSIGNFVLAVRDDGVQASAISGGATFTAVNFGVGGNSISLAFNGTADIDTVVNAWNAANTGNQVSFTGVAGSTVLGAQTVSLENGAANTVLTSADKDYSAFAVDKFGQLKVRDDAVLAQLVSGIDVSATNLDIRDLAFATDSVDVSGSSVSITGSVAVTATDLDIRDLTHVSDSVRLGDGTSFYTSTTVSSDIGLDVYQLNDPELANVAIASSAQVLTAANTAQALLASPLASRKYLFLMNNTNKNIFVGGSGVTTANGYPIPQGSAMELRAGVASPVYWISTTIPSGDVRTLELS